jgi:hypothetical protein
VSITAAIIVNMGRGSNNNLMYGSQPTIRSRASSVQEAEELKNVFMLLSQKDWLKAIELMKENSLQLNSEQLKAFQLSKISQELQQVDFNLTNYPGSVSLPEMVQNLYFLHKESQAPIDKSVLASFLEQDNNQNLVNDLIDNKYYLQCALYRNAKKSNKYIPPSYSYCNEQEQSVNWTEELDLVLDKRLPLAIREQIDNPESDFKGSLANLFRLSIEQQVIEQTRKQIDLENNTHSFAFGHRPFDRMIHYVPYNFGSRLFKVSKCSSTDPLRPVPKTDLEKRARMDFCSRCFASNKNQDEETFRAFLQESEKERQDNIVSSYKMDRILKDEIEEKSLLKLPTDEIKQQLLHKKSPLLRNMKNELRSYIKLMPKELRKSARQMEITVWGQKIH